MGKHLFDILLDGNTCSWCAANVRSSLGAATLPDFDLDLDPLGLVEPAGVPVTPRRDDRAMTSRRGSLVPVPDAAAFGPPPFVPAPPRLRLVAPPARRRPSYARRRVAAVVLLVALALAGQGLAGWLASSSPAGSPAPAPAELVARPGDTYWDLASRVHRGGDLRHTVDRLVSANGGRELRVGDRIAVTP